MLLQYTVVSFITITLDSVFHNVYFVTNKETVITAEKESILHHLKNGAGAALGGRDLVVTLTQQYTDEPLSIV